MADAAQTKAEKLAAARKKAEELKKKKKAGQAKAKKDKAAAKEEEESATDPTEEKPKETEEEGEAADEVASAATTEVEPSTPAGAEPATTASPFAPTDTESTTHADDTAAAEAATLESTAELEARVAELEKQLADERAAREEAQLTSDALEKKVVSLEVLHKEDESHINRLQRDMTELKNENVDLKDKLQKAEADNLRLSKKEAQDGGGTDNDHLDELEDEERRRLEERVRQLEAENTDLRRGIWHEKRKDMQSPMEDGTGGQFTNVPLGGPSSPSTARKQGGFGDFFTNGLNALTGGGGGHEHLDDDEGFLDDDEEFDEEAFRKAQEEAAKARIERIKEVKRGLKNWEGWRLDLVEGRRGGGEGVGEMFEI